MNLKLKNKSLSFQIWFIVGGIIAFSLSLLMLITPFILNKVFIKESYERIKESQEYLLAKDFNNIEEVKENFNKSINDSVNNSLNNYPPFRIVRHFFISENGETIGNSYKNINIETDKFKNEVVEQKKKVKDYERESDNGQNIVYVIRKTEVNGEKLYLISYLFSNHANNLVKAAFHRMLKVVLFILFIGWIASIFMARYLTKPLRILQKKVKDIAAHNWEDEVKLNRRDEIGELGKSVEWMRKELIRQDKKEQEFLQQVSHELKTPIMVIRSYVESIADGIFPQGDLSSSLDVIEKETHDLEKRVGELLNITKYDYLAKHKLNKKSFDISQVIKDKTDTFSWRNTEIDWVLNLNSCNLSGDKEQIEVVIENILDNMCRYARKKIVIEMKEENDEILIRFWNDGPELKEELLEDIFNKFKKGQKGKHGLGLAIVKKVVNIHNGRVKAQNEDNGAAFYIIFPTI